MNLLNSELQGGHVHLDVGIRLFEIGDDVLDHPAVGAGVAGEEVDLGLLGRGLGLDLGSGLCFRGAGAEHDRAGQDADSHDNCGNFSHKILLIQNSMPGLACQTD
jgi:hypothetical protein